MLLAGGYSGSRSEELLGRVRVVRGTGPAGLHLQLPELLRKNSPADVIVEDLGHVVPFLAEKAIRTPGVVFFRHLHRRTLPGQVGIPARVVLSAIERAYPYMYRRWPLVAPSASAMHDLTSLGFNPSRIHLIGYGVNTNTFKPGQLTAKPSLIYYAGLRPYKRPEHSLHVLRILRRMGIDASLSIVGRGSELSTLMRLSSDLGLSGHVRFTGWLSDRALSALLRESWVHLQCSVAEGWGLTTWEAAASGVPTVAYDVPGLADSVVPGVSGVLVQDSDVTALTHAVAAIIDSRPDWTARCREVTVGHSWKDIGARWDILLKEVSVHP